MYNKWDDLAKTWMLFYLSETKALFFSNTKHLLKRAYLEEDTASKSLGFYRE